MSSKTYFIFGEEAVVAFLEGIQDDDGNKLIGVYAVQYGDNINIFNYETFEFIEGETSPIILLSRYAGWGDWALLTKEEYEVL